MKNHPNFIAKAIHHVGALHQALGIPQSQDIPDAVLQKHAQGNSTMAHRVRLAMTLKKLPHPGSKPKPKMTIGSNVDTDNDGM